MQRPMTIKPSAYNAALPFIKDRTACAPGHLVSGRKAVVAKHGYTQRSNAEGENDAENNGVSDAPRNNPGGLVDPETGGGDSEELKVDCRSESRSPISILGTMTGTTRVVVR